MSGHTPLVALQALVAGLDTTNWSSWQSTAHFAEQLQASKDVIRAERIREVAPELLAMLQEARDQIQIDRDSLFESTVNQSIGKVDNADDAELVADYDSLLADIRAAIAKATGSAS